MRRTGEDQLFKDGIYFLELQARPAVLDGLLSRYGSTSGLFVALWNSNTQPRPSDYDDECESGEFDTKGEEYEYQRAYDIEKLHLWTAPYEETEDEILMEVTGVKSNLFAWLDQGAEPLSRYC